jgi:hypothetical protein
VFKKNNAAHQIPSLSGCDGILNQLNAEPDALLFFEERLGEMLREAG